MENGSIAFRVLLRPIVGLLLVYGCWQVLAPFASAISFAIAIAVSVWPAHARLAAYAGPRHRTLASLVSCASVGFAVIAPTILLLIAFRDAAVWLLALLDEWNASGSTHLPEWIRKVPLIREHVERMWIATVPSETGTSEWLTRFAEPIRKTLVSIVRAFGTGVGQILLAGLLLFAFFRDGDRVAERLGKLVSGIGGERAEQMLFTARKTLVGVVLGVLGTALAQAVLAIIGFSIAGIPNAFLLGALTFILSMAPVGPPLIWGGAALWLGLQGQNGWAIFMVLYGLLGISTIDNIVKPFVISHSSRLPFVLTLMGVLGGMIVFGIAGVFIGPVLLAVSVDLVRLETATQTSQNGNETALA